MKNVLRVLIAACLLLGLGAAGLAAPHGFQGYWGDYSPISEPGFIELEMSLFSPDTHIFSTEEQSPQLTFKGSTGVDGVDMTLMNAEYYQNDFVFGDLLYADTAIYDIINLRGGYLWEDLGVFVGLDYLTMSGDSGYIASGGYRFDLDGGGYAALSLDYRGGEYGGEITGEAIAKYFADGMKLTGQLVAADGTWFLRGKGNWAAGDDVVWGGGLTYWDDGDYEVFAGLTWTGDSHVFDGVINVDDSGDMVYYLSFLYGLTDDLSLGVNYLGIDESDNGLIAVKGQYLLGDGALTFSYATFTNDVDGGIIGLGYEMDL